MLCPLSLCPVMPWFSIMYTRCWSITDYYINHNDPNMVGNIWIEIYHLTHYLLEVFKSSDSSVGITKLILLQGYRVLFYLTAKSTPSSYDTVGITTLVFLICMRDSCAQVPVGSIFNSANQQVYLFDLNHARSCVICYNEKTTSNHI